MISKKGDLARRGVMSSKSRRGKFASSVLAISTFGLLLVANPKAHAQERSITRSSTNQRDFDRASIINDAESGSSGETHLLFDRENMPGPEGLRRVQYPYPTCGTPLGSCPAPGPPGCRYVGQPCICPLLAGGVPGQRY
jgi:hypothetical protein